VCRCFGSISITKIVIDKEKNVDSLCRFYEQHQGNRWQAVWNGSLSSSGWWKPKFNEEQKMVHIPKFSRTIKTTLTTGLFSKNNENHQIIFSNQRNQAKPQERLHKIHTDPSMNKHGDHVKLYSLCRLSLLSPTVTSYVTFLAKTKMCKMNKLEDMLNIGEVVTRYWSPSTHQKRFSQALCWRGVAWE